MNPPARNCKKPEANVVVALAKVKHASDRRLAVVPGIRKIAATRRTGRTVFVRHHFSHVAMHFEHSKRVGEIVPYGTGSFKR